MPRARRTLALTLLPLFTACHDRGAPTAPPLAEPQPGQFAVTGFDLQQIETSLARSCGIGHGGKAYCWGTNAHGQAGNGTFDQALVPTPVAGDLNFIALALNINTTCGITKGGQVLCWGDGTGGALGNGSSGIGTKSNVPVPVSSAVQFTAITGGEINPPSFGTTWFCALDKSGQLYCWGQNERGQFGDGTTEPRLAPTLIPGVTFSAIAGAGTHLCGLTRDGRAFCAGNFARIFDDGTSEISSTFVPVPGGFTFRSLTAASGHRCGIATTGRAMCWGGRAFIGSEPTSGALLVATPTPIASDASFTSINAASFVTCAITTKGLALCWGSNDQGQLGNGTTDAQRFPGPVSGGFQFLELSVGNTHGCGIIKGLGTWCWGGNFNGQLGDGTTTAHFTPSPVSAP